MSNIYRAKGIKLADQYEDVGRLFAKQLNNPVEIDQKKMQLVKRVLSNVRNSTELKVFYNCFAGWARGAKISQEHAMYLLADNTSGCQTAIVRYASGVALLHTEEDYYDVAARMSGEHTIEFRDGKRSLKCLTYNDLMPGAGLYGWQKDMIVAVDSLFLSEVGIYAIERPMLANIIAWMVWYLGPEGAEPARLVKRLSTLGSVVDGYTINVVWKNNGVIEGYKITFAREEWEVEVLGSKIGDNLRQVNIIEPAYARGGRAVARYRHSPWQMKLDYYGFLKRLRDMRVHLAKHQNLLEQELDPKMVVSVHNEIHQLVFERYRSAYVTEWMGAMCVGLLDKSGLSVSTKLNKTEIGDAIEYLDKI